MTKYLSILLLSFLVACGGGAEEKKDGKSDDKDSTETADSNTIDAKEVEENPEEVSIEEFEKSGEGMALCDCVKLVKSMDDEMMADATSEERMEEIMAEKDKLMDGECKVLKMGGQDSPEERAERQRQIKACK
jgi:hypothetical protein